MIRCDIKKGKQPVQQSLNKPPWDAAPRAADGFVLDLGNIGDKCPCLMSFQLGTVFQVPLLNSDLVKVSVAAALSTHRSEETTTWRRTPSPSSRLARLRPEYSGTASRRLNKPTNRSSKLLTPPPTTTGTSPATASRTSTGSTSTRGRRSRRLRVCEDGRH